MIQKLRKSTRLRIGSILLSLAATVLPIAWMSPVAHADSTLCSSSAYATCVNAGYTAHGFEDHYNDSPDGNGFGYWGAIKGHNCTNYVAYVLSTVNGVARPSGLLGNGSQWDNNVSSSDATVNSVSAVGAVAQWEDSSAHPGGHVAYVEGVATSLDSNGNTITTITVSSDSYNAGPFAWQKITNTSASWPDHFIHFQDLMDAPAMYTAPNGDIWLAAVNRLGEVYTQRFTASSGTWGSPTYHGGDWSTKSSAAITRDNNGDIWIAAVKLDGKLYAKRFDYAWRSWVQVDDKVSIDAGVKLVARTNGNVSMGYVSANGNIYHATGNASNWVVSGAHWAGNWSTVSMPALAVDSDGTMWMSAVKNNGHLYTWRILSGGDVMHPDDFSGYATTGGLDMVARSNGSVSLAAVTDGGDLIHRTYSPTNSSGSSHGTGSWSTVQSPSITLDNGGQLWIAAIKTNHHAYAYYYDSSNWQLTDIGAEYYKTSGLDIQPRTDGTVSVAGVNDDRKINHSTWHWSTDSWSDPSVHAFE